MIQEGRQRHYIWGTSLYQAQVVDAVFGADAADNALNVRAGRVVRVYRFNEYFLLDIRVNVPD